ncbi:phosphate butyryltransferase [Pseudalkalibacillus salsuginis]|uniref:phosphate butyryltransferase n=1 Tax=Pseudalkalibacillus salsuginis TaxID=2910972 RepID=UPI001F013C9E|nr:phosphate butyryltransferase [Pseudalkalibacillus salsuginis]MCF6408382.1 phosphate butyryltransferase [Pseudalkalibacillus salsuginis]
MYLEKLIEEATQLPNKIVAVAAAEDHEVIEAVKMALDKQIASFRLFGDEDKMMSLLQTLGLDVSERLKVIPCGDPDEAAAKAVQAVSDGEADVLMKGMVSTARILKAVLNKEYGLRTGKVLSHVAAFEVTGYDRLVFVTDAAMNIAPDLQQKAEIVQNAVGVAVRIGVENPKVAPITAIEVVNPSMEATLDAAALTQMNIRGQIKNCVVDGPLALDNAVSMEAAEHKGIGGQVAGQADILLVPNIETGNTLYKSLIYFARAKVGAVIAGAKAPIVLTSRADTSESKLYSIALAVRSI